MCSVCVCVCACVCLWLFPYSGSLVYAIGGADNAHSPGILACDMAETAQQPAGWWILATGVKFTGFWGVNMYNILDFWKVDKEMVRETNIMNDVNLHTPHLGSFIQYQKKRVY